MKILLIAGHGAGDPGAVTCGYREAELTREVAGLLSAALNGSAEVTVYDTSRSMVQDLRAGRSFNFKLTGGSDVFQDVPTTDYAYAQIKKLKDLGIVNGDNKGNFNPGQAITRRDMAVMIANMLKVLG